MPGHMEPNNWKIGTRFRGKGEPPVKGPAGSDFGEPLVRDQLVVAALLCLPQGGSGIFLLKACG